MSKPNNQPQPKKTEIDAARLELINGARQQIDRALDKGLITKTQALHIWKQFLNQEIL